MTYNLSLAVVYRWRNELDKLTENRVVLWSVDKPNKLAYALREAIAAAKKHGVKPYSELEYWFKEKDGLLIAEPKKPRVSIIDVQVLKQQDLVSQDFEIKSEEEIPEATTVFQVIEAVKHSKSHVIKFPEFGGDIDPLKSWAEAKGFIVTEDPVTFTRRS